MPTSSEIADWSSNYFAANQQRVAHVLAGPKRETWFSAETFVALNLASRPLKGNELLTEFSCWGEEQFSTVFNKVKGKAGQGVTDRKPDVVCYLPQNGDEAIDAVLELKLVLNAENPAAGLTDLKSQLLNARSLAPKAKVLGLVFIAAAPLKTPGTFDKSVRNLRTEMERLLPDAEGFSWVEGHDVSYVFRTVYTQFHYPSMTTSLALGVRELGTK